MTSPTRSFRRRRSSPGTTISLIPYYLARGYHPYPPKALTDSRIRPSWRQLATGGGTQDRTVVDQPMTPGIRDDAEELLTPCWPPFPAYSGAFAAARPHSAGDGYPDHRSPRPRIPSPGQAGARGGQDHFQDHQPGHHLHGNRYRRLGSRAGQYTEPGRPGADGGDRPVRDLVEEHGRQARPQA